MTRNMKPIHAFAIVCILPLTVLTAVGVTAAIAIPANTYRVEKFTPESATERSLAEERALAAASTEAAQEPKEKEHDANPDGEHAKGGLHDHMEVLQDGMKAMRRMLGKADQQGDLLALVTKLQGAARECFVLLPEQTTPIEDPKALAEWRIGYQRRMVEVYDTLLQLELAVYQGDADKVKELYQSLGAQKTSGHDAYQAD